LRHESYYGTYEVDMGLKNYVEHLIRGGKFTAIERSETLEFYDN